MIDISFSSLNIISIIPIAIILFGAISILILDLLIQAFYKGMYISLSIIFMTISLISLLYIDNNISGFFGFINIDGLSLLSQIIIIVASILFMFLIISKDKFAELECAEFYILFLSMIAGYQFMVSSNNLILIFLGLEASSLSLYTLIALNKKQKALEAAIKYFTLGALGSGFFAFGIMFIYASIGSLDIKELSFILYNQEYMINNKYFISLGFIFLVGAIGFKLSLFPFHTWVPDIYEGSNAPLAFYMSIVTKIAGFVVAIRVFDAFLGFNYDFIEMILFLIVVLTITIPNIIALLQNDVQRMLAYSSISQAGFGLACILINTNDSLSALFLYWILFLFTNLGAFGLLWLTHNKNHKWDNRFNSPYIKFSGLIKTMPLLAVGFGICMLSLGGIPPFGMFWGKLFIISASINANHYILALILLINSAIAIYYYIKLIIFMFLKEPINNDTNLYTRNLTYPMVFIIVISLLVSVFAIFLVDIILTHIQKYLFI
ncbi:NADH-quinone oxidoreductase subunit NuoN [Helicobacter sp. MIT 14-3879]|uniref:NADH-quinone oxidoreductase subunit NuoN n=1 Tax=Helicobacter sp. MIT 14-3879 TaxID=2040649 RepID=UPI000E1F9C11|nr:NADH-quinone oxidoreductase subunit NuoN [Helicobacter sp. MIT 14-3879]RDU63948.1 NADH-quinone oxidoreductase subunit NuoN [Helicobacter sp. MIT 14-3879]